ncbi:MAG: ketoacyl-ACP synthase III [Treponema sp.]|jgi:3-oxoacyl-[acyl-carrier-protein] synthase-3|nr:ketoacyl-ACP synthase III [Treponema sp.]
MAIKVVSTGRAIPPKRVTNEDLAAVMDTSDEWIRSHTGIGARHIAAEGVAASDLGFEAAEDALRYALDQGLVAEKNLEELAATIDLIVLGSSTQDYYSHPATACIIQHKLGAVNAAAFDVTVACSSFIYALETAAALLAADTRRKRAVVIGAEVLSAITNWEDRGSCVLFGDGAGAVLLEKRDGAGGLVRSILGSDGSGWEHLILRRGGSRNPWKKGEVVEQVPCIEMNGHAVYNFAVTVITKTIERFLDEEHLALEDLALIIPHQANGRIIQAAEKRLNIPAEKFYTNMEEYANTSSASIPIALDECNRSGKIKRGDLVLTVGFGGGLSYGGNLIRW